jgi:hypothetical protein
MGARSSSSPTSTQQKEEQDGKGQNTDAKRQVQLSFLLVFISKNRRKQVSDAAVPRSDPATQAQGTSTDVNGNASTPLLVYCLHTSTGTSQSYEHHHFRSSAL